ncbi:Lrp/AsnC family transcriptional regulator [Sciscionella sediminilitoris]|uniref:Lrp/AsnC family transcriptional regulator n=1 Tax=Sciscionella sediminilitoris TaxID=1445613 RepID=UPI0004DF1553|nr:Lrp/AsnC family transcriptional regulator [Sciscionella sp. SE31]
MTARALEPDELDLVAALQVNPRASLSLLAEALDVSVNTVRRRLSRLYEQRLVRVIGQLDWSQSGDGNPWHVWIAAECGKAEQVAAALAALDEVQMVATTAGRSDVYATVQPAHRETVHTLLTEGIQELPGIRSARSELVLRAFTKSSSWRLPRLGERQLAVLRAEEPPEPETGEIGADELTAVRLLHEDGRISAAQVARELGVAPSTAYRMTRSLLDRGIVRPSVEVEPRLLGYRLEALIALDVAPGAIDTVAETLAGHSSARYVTTVAGTSSVIHGGMFTDEEALTEFLTTDLAALPGIGSFEVSIQLNVHKRHWLRRMDGCIESPQGRKGTSHE